ncbi:MAG TPA: c-type cytochrome [Steroidobacteraceae bacterium]|nr:c-type cytochrome [Steroidobacteraceae bacterium]
MSVYRPARLLALAALTALAAPVFAADAKPDAENGKDIFEQRCGICHAVNKEPGGPVAGPNMVGLVGRKSASEPSFTMYSPALKAYGVTWSLKTLDDFLTMPMQKVPGTTMPMMLPDDKERADVIAYLSTLKKK